jgi:hypothetical protein
MILITTKLKSGGLHEKHVVATWKVVSLTTLQLSFTRWMRVYCQRPATGVQFIFVNKCNLIIFALIRSRLFFFQFGFQKYNDHGIQNYNFAYFAWV